MNDKIIFLKSVFKEMIWGGNRLTEFGYDIPSDYTGECWEISDIIPQVKSYAIMDGYCHIKNIKWKFMDDIDKRVVSAAERIAKSGDGLAVYVNHGYTDTEGYTLTVGKNEIIIEGDSPAGAFYGLMTLKMIMKSSDKKIECCRIVDSPDMQYRGFYQDTTRGRVPTLDTLKNLVDTMANYKMNSLQLYVEHSYDFKEYEHCKERLGYLTKSEIEELDTYCNDRFIELIPSLSTFGHLYHLLQCDKYKHLCELRDYEPAEHYWIERMRHHTINPLLDESFELVTSLIDQHMSAFKSDKFNICCDETFDLGSDVNEGKDKAELYIGFVKKLVEYLEAKGKTVMMWGDIILQHPECISELSENIIFLNWDYNKEPYEERVSALEDKTQYVCPGTSTWLGFTERVDIEESNILKLAEYGYKYGAKGILNTNWGDLGNPASIDMALYGLILGASAGWNIKTEANNRFRENVGVFQYGNKKAIEMLARLSEAAKQANWLIYHYNSGCWKYNDNSLRAFQSAQDNCNEVIREMETNRFSDDCIKNNFLLAARGVSLLITWSANQEGYIVPNKVDFNKWIKDYEENWLEKSKRSELDEVLKMLNKINNR